MGKRKSPSKSPASKLKNTTLIITPDVNSPTKLEKSNAFATPKQEKSTPNTQSETKRNMKLLNKKRKSMPANLINGSSNDVPTKKLKTEPFTGTAQLVKQAKEKHEPKNKNVLEKASHDAPTTPQQKGKIKKQNVEMKENNSEQQQKGKIKEQNVGENDQTTSNEETLTARAQRKKEKVKKIRLAAKDRFKKTISDVTSGDEVAIARIQSKIAELQTKEKLTYSGKRKLRKLRSILQNANILIISTNEQKPVQQNVKQNQNNTQKGNLKKEVQKSMEVKQENKKSNLQRSEHKKPQVNTKKDDNDTDNEESEGDELEESEIADESSLMDDTEDIDKEEESNEDKSEEDESEEEEEEDDHEKENEDDEMNSNSSDEESDDEAQSISEKVVPINQPPNKAKSQLSDAMSSPSKGQSRYVVFVGNLPYDITKQEISEHFAKIDGVKHIRIPLDIKTNKCRGFAYVELLDQASYEKALSLHHTTVKGRRINVLYTQGGKKNGEEKKKEIKAKNFKLKSMREEGKLAGTVKNSQKRSFRRTKQRNANKKE